MSDENIKTFEANTTIISEGDNADLAYIIVGGDVRVFLEKDGKEVTLANLGIGDMFGESALFSDSAQYGANVVSSTKAEVLCISPADFKEKLEAADPMIRNMYNILMERLRKTNTALLESETREFMDLVFV